MTQRNNAPNRLHYLWQRGLSTKRLAYNLPAQSLCLLSSVSLLSGGLVYAQTETQIDNIVPTIENSQPTAASLVKKDTAAPESTRTQANFAERRATLTKKLRRSEVSQSTAPVNRSQSRLQKTTIERAEVQLTGRQSQPKIEASEPVVRVRKSTTQAKTSSVTPASVSEEKPKVEVSQPRTSFRQEKPITPRSLPEKLPEVAQPANNSNQPNITTAGKTKDYNNSYIDPTNYNTDTTATYQAPNSVVLTERSSGCRAVLPSGQNLSAGICAKTPSRDRLADTNTKPAPSWIKKSQNAQLANVPPVRQLATNSRNTEWRAPRTVAISDSKTTYRPNRFIPNPNDFATTRVSTSAIAPSAGTLPPPMADGNVAPRPSNVSYDFALASVLPQIPFSRAIAYAGGTGMVYPLSIPAPITSLFGWRVHPITGTQRFHAGTDLGVPMGTPILAATRGQVESADWMGGYGLAVVIQHNSTEQTLYGHMSEILVKPGQWVEPGVMIGRVGSTGASTGPHLHFEVRHLTQDGWVAVDPSTELQAGLSQLVQTLQTAQLTQRSGS
ncbi:peptidoglycan DD-metalloendopeptidase family protein [Nostocaceae cyanobacterium CENA369]|uniref:Peptidoglycan DD-metalloendopeptidase family protein n=1 Tax=Dendronalium phyllosphericum CENA369 TaxID=1725256 RepID=A0A8J7IAG8_9NOST|nr:M23 family metallopeptidase [Dendronalium phyllosphericum]MBH8576006.1 peptidoglycan DD-metalloendopeptidase family protein [Dendronalium phyllosphericum CENA369]